MPFFKRGTVSRKTKFCKASQLFGSSRPGCRKILLPFCRISANRQYVPPRQEGRTRRHERGAGCDGRDLCRATSGTNADDEIVWSWRPWAGAKSAGDEPAGDGDYEVTDTGESTKISVNTIARGRPDVSVEPVVNNSCASYTAHEAAGAASARSSLRPLLFEGRRFSQSLGHAVSREGRRASALRVERSNPKRSLWRFFAYAPSNDGRAV
jgi:hypothetical protein